MPLPVDRTKKKVARDKKSLALCVTRLLYVWNILVGPCRHPTYTRAPAWRGRGWAIVSGTSSGTESSSSLRPEACKALGAVPQLNVAHAGSSSSLHSEACKALCGLEAGGRGPRCPQGRGIDPSIAVPQPRVEHAGSSSSLHSDVCNAIALSHSPVLDV